ncbi:MAG TPA: CcmD family protein [Candidatus Acetothermia bacterium]|nr:CcmD family protein [Candidatus Acetothermia bacterium]
MTYLAAAYAVFWGVTFLYVFSIASRQRRLQREIDALKENLRDKSQ